PIATTIPGYHAVIAVLARIVGGQSPDMLRLYSTFLSFLCVMAFYLAAKQRKNTSGLLPVVQFMMLPILFPYSVLVYTDLFALATVVFCYYLHLRKKLLLAGLFGLIACCVRQTNIVWIAMFFLLPFFEEHRHEPENTISLISIRQHVATYWPYPLILSLFMAFVYLNNGISVGMQEYMHIKIQLNNVFFFLIVFFAIYLP